MPFTVITLSKVPSSLRGDLTKWLQEVASGVYVGNLNTKVREKLWDRVKDNLKDGEATISYYYRNEIGYKFETINGDREVLDSEGLPLVLIKKEIKEKDKSLKEGFSKAAQFKKIKNIEHSKVKKSINKKDIKKYAVLDLETDGLNPVHDNIIEIGVVKVGEKQENFQRFIKIEGKLPEEIKKLTRIDDEMLEEKGIPLKRALEEFIDFIGDTRILGYNVAFDIKFLNSSLEKEGLAKINNKVYDIMQFVKKDNLFLNNYKLETVLKSYSIDEEVPHRALEDAILEEKLIHKVNKLWDIL
ncbi:DNA polymerase III polC-type [Peptoniphilus harei]|uniref:type I-E CRISPR-associated endoribonuclease Cas2e n=1 Tax=Peptoniphilus harei TaxID=54005 RepID=UPI000F704DC3|nr:type I-E CRISPR-associated endoribonuclease Cas2e [Peptoniphilus harei]MDU1177337.1 type I-E CRISPR-associated endoribonuclease Cas2e [Peptoniphilus harei]MDU2372912.1 type I-E CRISPR-associated endoribonuclease Cas2e [Peptoniphilus harei]MDU5470681.1 type I-E CRISPR-associated endoribonuclease Cas2e [Peptoniphilus harei]MDU6098073.1 type I-E CRISPR-associated endoribonuclease Cas2e [Peptoniphilus harei]QQE46186.1 type I-E CRISPR-associated endoribonuclease Cas2 [Peptoniphilus harei]